MAQEKPAGTAQEQSNDQILDKTKGIGADVYDILGKELLDQYLKEIGDAEGFLETLKAVAAPAVEKSIGIALNQALTFAYTLGDLSSVSGFLSSLLKEINEVKNPNEPSCRILSTAIDSKGNVVAVDVSDTTVPPIDVGVFDGVVPCLEKSPLYQAAAGGSNDNALEVIKSIFNVIAELNKPADPAECINPYFDQFFNLIPLQFIIAKVLRDAIKSALEGLTEQEIEETIRNVEPCGAELTKIYKNNLDLPEIMFPLFKLPALPTIPNINLYTVLNKLIVEAVCYTICTILTPLIIWTSKKMNDFLNEFLTDKGIGAGSYTEFLDKSLGKLNLNKEISDTIIAQAIIQKKVGDYNTDLIKEIGPAPIGSKVDRNGYWKAPTTVQQNKVLEENILLIRKYFKEIYDYKSEPFTKKVYSPSEKKYVDKESVRELGTKELIFLTFGEFNCFTINDLIVIGDKSEFKKLRLNEEKRIVDFFKFIGSDIDPIQTITDLKKEACPPEPCEEVEQKTIEEVQNRMSELCKVLDLRKSGLPPLPINEILKAVGLSDLFNQGIKEQFKQLKTEQLLYLGFPSFIEYPTIENISPFLPQEKGSYNDYGMWVEQKVKDPKLFRFFFLRGGPPLIWRYDNVNINNNLAGSTLEDVCGEDETLLETFIYIFNDIFKIDINTVNKSLEKSKETYTESFSKRVQVEFDKRKNTTGQENPCCKFKDTVIILKDEDGEPIVSGDGLDDFPIISNPDPNTVKALTQIVYTIYDAAEGAGSGDLATLADNLTREQRCWICRQENIFGAGDPESLISFISGEYSDFDLFMNALNCQEFGFPYEGGFTNVPPDSFAGRLKDKKC